MKYGSVCSGIEAATVAWEPLGWEPRFFSEVEAFPSAVLAHHYQNVPNYGDMTKFKEWPDATLDVLVGGTPCQSFSVAGLRKGLDDPRGNLMLTYLAIAKRYSPRWVVWENVPGVLSSNGGRDFGTLLGGLAKLGYGTAYRVLDAQYVRVESHARAVPQRRRRVFVVGCLGDWRRSAAVLFERESLRWHPAPSRKTGQETTEIAGTLSANGGGTTRPAGNCNELDFCVTVMSSGQANAEITRDISPALNCNRDGAPIAFQGQMSNNFQIDENLSQTLGAKNPQAVALMLDTLKHKGYNAPNQKEVHHASTQKTDTGKILRELREEVGEKAFAEWGLGILDSLQPTKVLQSHLHGTGLRLPEFSRCWVVYCTLSRTESRGEGAVQSVREALGERRSSFGWGSSEQRAIELGTYLSELSQPGAQAERFMRDLWQTDEGFGVLRQTLSEIQEVGRPSGGEGQPVYSREERGGAKPSENVFSTRVPSEISRERVLRKTCTTSAARDAGGVSEEQIGANQVQMVVRRLTPTEAEFLQGLPRNYTLVPYNGKPAADAPRYKALGNSMAVNVMRWIGERIQMVEELCQGK